MFKGPVRPHELILPAEIFYAADNCSSRSNLQQMSYKFQAALQSTIRMQDGCSSNPGDCLIEQVRTSCHHTSSDARWQRIVARATEEERRNKIGRRRRQRTLPLSQLPYVIPVQFRFATRISRRGRWPDQYHRALKRLLGMFDYFDRQVSNRAFTLRYSVASLVAIQEIPSSLTFAREISVCEIGYQFQHGIKLCGEYVFVKFS